MTEEYRPGLRINLTREEMERARDAAPGEAWKATPRKERATE